MFEGTLLEMENHRPSEQVQKHQATDPIYALLNDPNSKSVGGIYKDSNT